MTNPGLWFSAPQVVRSLWYKVRTTWYMTCTDPLWKGKERKKSLAPEPRQEGEDGPSLVCLFAPVPVEATLDECQSYDCPLSATQGTLHGRWGHCGERVMTARSNGDVACLARGSSRLTVLVWL